MAVTLFNEFGRPIEPPTVPPDDIHFTKVRDHWYAEYFESGTDISPPTIRESFRLAEQGEISRMIALAEQTEKRDAALRSAILTRKLAVVNRAWHIDPVDDSAENIAVAEEVDAALRKLPIAELVLNLMDSVYKGFAVSWITWEISEGMAAIRGFQRSPQQAWTYTSHEYTADSPVLLRPTYRTAEEPYYGIAPHPYSYVLHQPQMIGSLPQNNGLFWCCALLFVLKNYGLKDWAVFLARYGQPTRIAKHPPNTLDDTIQKVLGYLRQMGTDAVGTVPSDWDLELFGVSYPAAGRRCLSGLSDLDQSPVRVRVARPVSEYGRHTGQTWQRYAPRACA